MPYPYGGKQRYVSVDLNYQKLPRGRKCCHRCRCRRQTRKQRCPTTATQLAHPTPERWQDWPKQSGSLTVATKTAAATSVLRKSGWRACDQLRKAQEQASRIGNDATAAETKLVEDTLSLLDCFYTNLAALPKLLSYLCEGCERDDIKRKVEGQISNIFRAVLRGVYDAIKDTPLAARFPDPERQTLNDSEKRILE
ncbi:MAG TPA: hypothetical protein VNY04_11040 [Chthoniobacterales bacterium]|nr:hypothetical protein [Chthoniobacterales bacterium]